MALYYSSDNNVKIHNLYCIKCFDAETNELLWEARTPEYERIKRMVTYESQCVGCPAEMGCIGDYCQYKHVPVLTCDECNEEVEELYEWDCDNDQRCLDCMLEVAGIRKVKA